MNVEKHVNSQLFDHIALPLRTKLLSNASAQYSLVLTLLELTFQINVQNLDCCQILV